MKRLYARIAILASVTALAGLLLMYAHPVRAAINQQIAFQGKLVKSDGTNTADGSYSIRFRIYTDSVADASNPCSANSCVWEETQPSVTVTDGTFYVALGSITSLSSVDFTNPSLYIGIDVNSDGEMTPRIRLNAAPYAFNSQAVGGLTASQLVRNDAVNTFTANQTVQGGLTVQSTAGSDTILNVDPASNTIKVGNDAAASGADTTLLVLDTAPTTNAPTGTNGGMYYDTTLQKFRCYENGNWKNCAEGESQTIGQFYDSVGGTDMNSTTPTAIPWDSETRKDNGIAHDNTTNNTRVYLDSPGWYQISYNINGTNQSINRNTTYCRLRFNGTTYNQPSGSYAYTRNTTDGSGTNTSSVLVQTTSTNEYYEVVCTQAGSAGSQLTNPGQSWTTVQEINSNNGSTLQATYDNGSTISATNGRDIQFTLNDTATDPNFIVNLLCTTVCGTDGRFAVQSGGNDVFTTNPDGSITRTPAVGKTSTTNLNSGSKSQFVAVNAQTDDLVVIDNTGFEPTVTNANGEHITYGGGNAAVQGAGLRIDYTPGGTSGGSWGGVRIVANATGAATGVDAYGMLLEGPTTSGGGNNTAVKIASGWDIGLDVGSGGLQLATQSNPATPAAGNLRLYAKTIAGRTMLKAMGPSGIDYPLQPSLFQNQVSVINVQSGTASNYFGTSRSTSGTGVTAAFDENYGYMGGWSTGTTANTSAGIANNGGQFARGSKVGANGFFMNIRGALKDASYGSGTTGARIFVGMIDQTIATTVASQNAAGNRVGFSFDTGRGDTNWQVTTKNGTSETLADTGLVFSPAAAYDWYIYVPPYPNNNTIYWRIDNITDGTSAEGTTSATLPTGTAALRATVAIRNLSAVARTISYQRIYVESDR